MRRKTKADIERSVEMQGDGRAFRMHGLVLLTDPKLERIAFFLDADAGSVQDYQTVRCGAARQFDGVVIEALTDHQCRLAIAKTGGIGPADRSRERDIARRQRRRPSGFRRYRWVC